MDKHIHADLMLQYAQDAQEADKPWERWECNTGDGLGWVDMKSHPAWITETSYRRKPKTLSVTLANGEVVSWPEPLKASNLEAHKKYFYVDADLTVDATRWVTTGGGLMIEVGMVHLTKDAAEQHATALHKINTQGRDNG